MLKSIFLSFSFILYSSYITSLFSSLIFFSLSLLLFNEITKRKIKLILARTNFTVVSHAYKTKKNFENNISIFIDSNIAYSIVYYSTVHKIIRKELRNPIRDISKESNVNKYCRRSNCRIESSGGPRVTVRAERVNKRNFNECYSLIRTIGRRTP